MSPHVSPAGVLVAVPDPERSGPLRSVLSAAWHGLWHAAVTSPWPAIAVTVPAVALLVGCTRLAVRGD